MSISNRERIRVINLSSYTRPEVKESSNQEWVEYGEDNDYFQYLIDRYNGSPTNNAIINGIVELLYGKGLDATDSARKPDMYAQFRSMISEESTRRIVGDYKQMGQCSFQVQYSEGKASILKAEHWPIETLRAEKCNDNGDIEGYYYAHDWDLVASGKVTPERFPAFGFGSGENEILWIKPYRAGYYYYAPVDYQGGLPYAELEEQLADYFNNSVKNGFSANMVINFNNGIPDEEKQVEMEARIAEKFTGSPNANRFVLAFNDNKEQSATIEAIDIPDASNQFKFMSDEALQKIMLAHRVTSPMLLGIKDQTGLGNNAEELKTASILFDNTVIRPLQSVIIDGIQKLLAYNDISLNLYFKTLQPLEFQENVVIDQETKEEETGVKLHSVYLDSDPCWEGYEMIGYKEKDGKRVPNCVPKEGLKEELGKQVASALINFGEEINESEWELIDERPVNYDTDTMMTSALELSVNERKSVFSKIKEAFASVIPSTPNETSEQDTSIIKVRYVYSSTDDAKSGSRDFCKMMMSAERVYRKEDIVEAGAVNPGFGPEGSNTYDVWLYKGGPWCQHYWMRRTYLRKNNKSISVSEAQRLIVALDPSLRAEARIERNPTDVAKAPRFMPNNGYLNPRN